MVHGGGHCSGGGGGGFSGGGFRTTVYSNNYYSSPRSYGRGGSDDCDCTCCKTCCLAITCVSLKPKSRLRFLWFLVIAITLITSLSVSLGTYGKHTTDTSSSDMRHISNGISPRFCTGVNVRSQNYPVSVYMLPNKPVVNTRNKTTFTYNKYSRLGNQMYEYWGFYLLENSFVTIKACSSYLRKGVDYYFVKGKQNLQKWKNDNYCDSCFEDHKTTYECNDGNSTFLHIAYTSDEYYFVFANHLDYSGPVSVTVTIELQRTYYDLSSAVHKCMNSYECDVSYTSDDYSETVVVEIPHINTESIEVESTCYRRAGVFVGLFFVMPLGIGISISAVIYFACIRKRTKTTSTPYRIMQNPTGAQYSTFPEASAPVMEREQELPPAYPGPPSYEESTKTGKK